MYPLHLPALIYRIHRAHLFSARRILTSEFSLKIRREFLGKRAAFLGEKKEREERSRVNGRRVRTLGFAP